MDKKTILGTTMSEELDAFEKDMNNIDEALKSFEKR